MQTLQEREAVLRIIAGSCRGRIFEAPKGLSTRPTLDRVKEAVFGSVQFQVPGAVVLDLFSGSGNMGLEAASRGASRVVCVDHDPACAALIRRNGEKLGLIRSDRLEKQGVSGGSGVSGCALRLGSV